MSHHIPGISLAYVNVCMYVCVYVCMNECTVCMCVYVSIVMAYHFKVLRKSAQNMCSTLE